MNYINFTIMYARKMCILSGLMLLMVSATEAQTAETFSVATLNVDGLPQKLLVFNVNADGPGSVGSVRIGKYLAQKDYDMVFLQEDFNYHGELEAVLEDNYRLDEWSGDVDVAGHDIDYMHLQNHRFTCDGLMGLWKPAITITGKEHVSWTDGFGKFSHALDEMVTKGFRRYEVKLASGTEIVVYNMHMDAEDDVDSKSGNATKDRKAREGQWQQLRDDILNKLDTRPVVVVGDLNSYYFRDRVKALFVDAINNTDKATVADSWIVLRNDGQYPDYQEDNRMSDDEAELYSGETLDKIICINPTGGQQLRPIAYSCDKEGYLHNGKPLGDHYPIAVTFEVVGATGIYAVHAAEGKANGYYDLQGRHIEQPLKGIYIQRDEKNTRKMIVK
jgi:endonuclease/exonuclease/phosphatase family metal-dependent hydrolase